MSKYWLLWFIGWFTTFIVPEVWALASGHSENTLSAAVWRLEGRTVGIADPLRWNAAHMMFTSVFILLTVWLIGHFGWHIWR